MFACRDLGRVLPDSVWLKKKSFCCLMAYLARWLHTCALWWMTTEALTGSTFQENCIHFLHFWVVTPTPHTRSFSFGVIFSFCLHAPLSTSFLFLFLSASLPLHCQHFTVDIQLLAGHSIVIPFRAAPFSAGPQTAIQITSSAAFRVAALQNVVFKHFWGHHLIWSPEHNWMSVVT